MADSLAAFYEAAIKGFGLSTIHLKSLGEFLLVKKLSEDVFKVDFVIQGVKVWATGIIAKVQVRGAVQSGC